MQVTTRVDQELFRSYTPAELRLAKFLLEITELENREIEKGRLAVYPNQQQTAERIRDAFDESEDILYVLVAAFTQSGKTGSMLSLIKEYVTNEIIPPENVFIITGLSSVDWKEQTKDRCPESIRSHVFHLNELNGNFKEAVKDKKDLLIFIDELHIACEAGNKPQTMAKVFQDIGLSNPDYCYENNIKFVEYSATPSKVLKDRMMCAERYKIIKAVPPPNYVGPRELRERDQLLPNMDLTKLANCTKLLDFIKNTYGHDYRYHLVRLPPATLHHGPVIDALEGNDSGMFASNSEHYHGDGNIDKIEKTLEKPPSKHTFIFLKNMIGCAKTIENKQHIGVWFSRFVKKPTPASVIQDLRLTGYNVPDDVYIFCHDKIIDKYLRSWDSDFRIPFDNPSNRVTRGRDQWAIDLLGHEYNPLRTDNLKWYIFDSRENTERFAELNLNLKMRTRCKYKPSGDNNLLKTAEQLAMAQYQFSTSNDRWKRIICGSDDKYAVYWDGNHPSAPNEITGLELASVSSE
tara:strand:+ start:117 stop:1673 length:1557 start_codon:yes stop_codon:yes gene_type:complete